MQERRSCGAAQDGVAALECPESVALVLAKPVLGDGPGGDGREERHGDCRRDARARATGSLAYYTCGRFPNRMSWLDALGDEFGVDGRRFSGGVVMARGSVSERCAWTSGFKRSAGSQQCR